MAKQCVCLRVRRGKEERHNWGGGPRSSRSKERERRVEADEAPDAKRASRARLLDVRHCLRGGGG